MSFREELKPKKDYFMGNYEKEEILRTFEFMLERMKRAGEIQGKPQDIKMTEIDGPIITVQVKTNENGRTRIYRVSLEFSRMENSNFSRKAKIASPERNGEVIELMENDGEEEKEKYYEEKVIDIWDEKEARTKRIEEIQETNYFVEKYKKETILKIVDIMIAHTIRLDEIQGKVLARKIIKIEGMKVEVAVKTKDKEEIRIYRLDLDFQQMKNITYRKEAKVNSPVKANRIVELQGGKSQEEKEDYYGSFPDFWDMKEKEMKEQGEKEQK